MINTFSTSPGSLYIINGIAKFKNVFLYFLDYYYNNLTNSNVCNAAIHDVVVAIAGIIYLIILIYIYSSCF